MSSDNESSTDSSSDSDNDGINFRNPCVLISAMSLLLGIVFLIADVILIAIIEDKKERAQIAALAQNGASNATNQTVESQGNTKVTARPKATQITTTIATTQPKVNNKLYVYIGNKTKKRGWINWTDWSECTKTCGIGERTRDRFCYSKKCPQRKISEKLRCFTEACVCTIVTTIAGKDEFYIIDDTGTLEPIVASQFPHRLQAKKPKHPVYDPTRYTMFWIEGNPSGVHVHQEEQ